MNPLVSVVKVKESVFEAVQHAMNLARVFDVIEPGADVCLKPNLGFDLYYPGAVTSSWVVEGVILALKDRVKSITVVESDQVLVDIEKALHRAGIGEVLNKYNIEFVNMSKGKFVEVQVENPRHLQHLSIPQILTERPFITIPVMKTHGKTIVSGAIKNQWGCLDVLRHNYHLVIDEVLSDIHKTIMPLFAVCDATIALEGDGPKTGNPRIINRILASKDIVALDAVSAKMMGFDPGKIRHLELLEEDGVGKVRDFHVVGEDIGNLNFNFKPAGHNMVSVVELSFRKSLLRKMVFETPLLSVMCTGAKIWYGIWYYLGRGNATKNKILTESQYGNQS